MSEGLAECEWISGVFGVGDLSKLRDIVTSADIDIIARRAYGDRHESGQPSAD